jgi:hypothetical protein
VKRPEQHEIEFFEEIKPGVVFFLEPRELLAQGATYTCDDIHSVKDPHFFVCRWSYASSGVGFQSFSPSAGAPETADGGTNRFAQLADA